MFLIVVLVPVGGVSVVVARTIQHGIRSRQLIGDGHGSAPPSRHTAPGALMTASLAVAVFVPLILVAYVGAAVVRHALGQ
jgi:hypothetical protein